MLLGRKTTTNKQNNPEIPEAIRSDQDIQNNQVKMERSEPKKIKFNLKPKKNL